MHGLFYIAKEGSWVSKLIAFVTKRDKVKGYPAVSHYEHMFDDDTFYSASEQDGCTRFKSGKDIHPESGKWIKVPIDLTKDQKREVLGKCMLEEGAKYDFLGTLFWHTPFENPSKDFCSEQGFRHLYEVDYLKTISGKCSPNKLLGMLIHKQEEILKEKRST